MSEKSLTDEQVFINAIKNIATLIIGFIGYITLIVLSPIVFVLLVCKLIGCMVIEYVKGQQQDKRVNKDTQEQEPKQSVWVGYYKD